MDIRYTRTARQFMLEQDADTYHAIRGLVLLISTDPWPDGERIILVPLPPAYVPCYMGDERWIMYLVSSADGEEEMTVIAIGQAGTRPAWRR